ncbi:MAG: hypothetical protein EBQ82_11050 [Betaproteobacteria bacterium]|nr:hypothetical protein [Betaproteobacteria bacterium]NBY05902.1 hypothetical protein [Betaproteobacteria bacterium]
MDTLFSYRVDGKARQWGGNNSPQNERQNRRQQKLQALLQSLKAGDLDGSRLAFTALINFDPSVSGDINITKIGTALQSSNLYSAQHFGLELQSRGLQVHPQANTQDGMSLSKRKNSFNHNPANARIDFSA